MKAQLQIKEQEEKKMRADMIVGGGCNLNKAPNLKSAGNSQASGFSSSKTNNFKTVNKGEGGLQKRPSKN
jgi:hypothetical protein